MNTEYNRVEEVHLAQDAMYSLLRVERMPDKINLELCVKRVVQERDSLDLEIKSFILEYLN